VRDRRDEALARARLPLGGDLVILEAGKALAKLLNAVWEFKWRFTFQRRDEICGDEADFTVSEFIVRNFQDEFLDEPNSSATAKVKFEFFYWEH
jgi:hypothetical protein